MIQRLNYEHAVYSLPPVGGLLLRGHRNRAATQPAHPRRRRGPRLLHAKNEALRQPAINRQIARAYLTACDPLIATRTWQNVMDEIPRPSGNTRTRWETAIKDQSLRPPPRAWSSLETRAEHFLRVLERGGGVHQFLPAAHSQLRPGHGLAAVAGAAQKRWPIVRFKAKRAITWEEHQKILAGREHNPEWHGVLSAPLVPGRFPVGHRHLCAPRTSIGPTGPLPTPARKTGSLSLIRFGEAVAEILRSRLQAGLPASP